jgi:hypothetical protein
MAQYCIVIAQLRAEKLDGAAEGLGKVLGIGAASAKPVLQALPTVLFSELDYQQARRVMSLLADTAAAGAGILLAEGDGGGIPKVKWPGEPVVNGRPLSAYQSPAGGTRCPICGSTLRADVYLQEETGTSSDGLPLPDLPRLPRESPRTPGASGRHTGASLNMTDVEKVWKERASKSGIHQPAKETPANAAPAGTRECLRWSRRRPVSTTSSLAARAVRACRRSSPTCGASPQTRPVVSPGRPSFQSPRG